jgi:pyruvate/2-oxoglutarate dehydrogenase complex dihydrolipoamide acyltransferase (E2) component
VAPAVKRARNKERESKLVGIVGTGNSMQAAASSVTRALNPPPHLYANVPAVHTRVQGPPPALPPVSLCRYSVRLPQPRRAANSSPARTSDASSCGPHARHPAGVSPTTALYSRVPTTCGSLSERCEAVSVVGGHEELFRG